MGVAGRGGLRALDPWVSPGVGPYGWGQCPPTVPVRATGDYRRRHTAHSGA
ncbi:unnamed protein product, partial [Musa textilis]